MLETFIKTVGAKFKTPTRPNNWLGDDRPFPLNPSFKPPIPVSDELRTSIYRQFMANPEQNSVRVLAGKYYLSMKRVDAILRLKGLEEHWKQKKPLQTGFLAGMEWCLGVRHHAQIAKIKQWDETDHPRYNVREADALMEAEGNDPARLRYRNMFWEAVPDGKDPVVPLLLEKARSDGIRHVREEEESKNHPKFVPPQPGTESMEKVKMVAPTGRPMIKFVDVEGKFIDKLESLKRSKQAVHRAALKVRRRKETLRNKQVMIQENRQIREAARESARAAAKAAVQAKMLENPKWQPGTGRSLVLS
jgi:hypothetical protein